MASFILFSLKSFKFNWSMRKSCLSSSYHTLLHNISFAEPNFPVFIKRYYSKLVWLISLFCNNCQIFRVDILNIILSFRAVSNYLFIHNVLKIRFFVVLKLNISLLLRTGMTSRTQSKNDETCLFCAFSKTNILTHFLRFSSTTTYVGLKSPHNFSTVWV